MMAAHPGRPALKKIIQKARISRTRTIALPTMNGVESAELAAMIPDMV